MLTCVENEQKRGLPFVFLGRFVHPPDRRSPRKEVREVQPIDIARSTFAIAGQDPYNARERTPIAAPLLTLVVAHSQGDETQTPASETHFEQPGLGAKAQATLVQLV